MEDIDELANGDSDDEFYFVAWVCVCCVCVVRHHPRAPAPFLFEGAVRLVGG